MVACFNLDMVGRLRENLVLQGIGSSPLWPQEIEKRNAVVGLPLTFAERLQFANRREYILSQRGADSVRVYRIALGVPYAPRHTGIAELRGCGQDCQAYGVGGQSCCDFQGDTGVS